MGGIKREVHGLVCPQTLIDEIPDDAEVFIGTGRVSPFGMPSCSKNEDFGEGWPP